MDSDNYKIGIDLGGTKIEIILLDKSGTELFRKRIKTPQNSYSLTLELISKLVFEAEKLISFDATVGTKYKRFNLEFFGLCKKCK